MEQRKYIGRFELSNGDMYETSVFALNLKHGYCMLMCHFYDKLLAGKLLWIVNEYGIRHQATLLVTANL